MWYEAATDLLPTCQEEDHLLLDRGQPPVTETTESEATGQGDYSPTRTLRVQIALAGMCLVGSCDHNLYNCVRGGVC